MSPREKDRRRISGRVIGAAGAGGGILLISIGALISIIGGGSDIPGTGASVVRLDLLAARDVGALPARNGWCGQAQHCWVFQQSTGNATDYGTPGGWHLSPVGTPRDGVVTSLPVRDASGWVDYTGELSFAVDGVATDYFQKASATISGTNLFSASMVISVPSAQADLYTLWGPPGLTGTSLFLATSGTLLGYFWNNSTFKSASFPGTGLDDGAWHCVTVVLDGRTADAAKLWIDGTEVVASSQNLDETPGISTTGTLKTMGAGGALRSQIARWVISETAYTYADHLAYCGDLWQPPAGGPANNKPLASDDTWTQTAGAGCYPTGSTSAVCVPGGLVPYTVDATGMGWPVQQALTNELLYSTAVDCTNWTCIGSASATPGAIAPDGSSTASLLAVAVGANHVEQDILGAFTADASPLYLGMWFRCLTGTIHPHGSDDGTRGDWDIDCSCVGGQWTYLDADHPCITVNVPFNADSSGNSGLHFDGGGLVSGTLWAPTLTEQRPWSDVVIPTAASAVSLGSPIWAIANSTGAYYRAGDTVLQSLSEYSGTCFAVPGSDILLSGSPTCSGTWYGLQVRK